MKKRIHINRLSLMVIAAMLAALLSGCGQASSENTDELTIYYLSSDAKVQRYILDYSAANTDVKIQEKSFDDAKQMDEVITNELNAGKGPDIIIFSMANELDVLRMAKSGAFASLDEFIKEDQDFNPENYLPGALEAGKVDGKQYILPLTFKLPLLYYNETPELGLESEAVISNDEFITALDTNIERFREDDDKGAIIYTDLMSSVMAFENAIQLSDNNRKVEYDEAKLEQIVEIIRKIYIESEKLGKITSSYGGDNVEIVKRFGMIMGFSDDIVHDTWIFNNFFTAANMENFHVSALSQEDNGQIYGLMSSFGVVNSNAGKQAYEFLRKAMDCNASSGKSATYGLSLNKTAINSTIQAHKNASSVLQTKSGVIKMGGMPENIADDLNDIMDQIGGIKILNIRVLDILYDSFEAYFQGQKVYSDCLDDFKQKMNLYISE